MWHADHDTPPRTVEARLQALMARVPEEVGVEARITRGGGPEAVLTVAEAVGADLTVLSTHGPADDHASVTEHMLARSECAVLALHDGGRDAAVPMFAAAEAAQAIVVPTDLRPEARASVRFAFELARRLPLELHLLHVLPARSGRESREVEAIIARDRLELIVPDDLAGRARVHVSTGDAAQGIAGLARRLGAACIVMGEHTRAPLRRWFTRDTSRAVLHDAPCPVWYVPARHAA
jgi:nucleotide-binding universal stress UspA family protein